MFLPVHPEDIPAGCEALTQQITQNLAGHARNASAQADAPLLAASVTVLLIEDDAGRACFVLTRRPSTMRRHANQFALPGGRRDDGESAQDAALREVAEEVGIVLRPDDVLGMLDDYETRSGFVITPFVAWAGRCPTFLPNPAEVAELHCVPIAELMNDKVVSLTPAEDAHAPVVSLGLLNNWIFAPTAALILQFREVALLGRETRVAHLGQPRFAWR